MRKSTDVGGGKLGDTEVDEVKVVVLGDFMDDRGLTDPRSTPEEDGVTDIVADDGVERLRDLRDGPGGVSRHRWGVVDPRSITPPGPGVQ